MARKAGHQGTKDKFIAALNQDGFILYSQTIKPISSGADRSGFQEILIRYREEEEKLLPPGGFFPILESCDLMTTLDRWVVNRVIKWLLAKRKAGKGSNPPKCSINLSGDSVADAGFAEFVKEQLEVSPVTRDRIAFEIPEEDANDHAVALGKVIEELGPLGCTFAISGYTGEFVAADMLQALMVNFVKIDSRIVRNLHQHDGSYVTADAIHRTCQDLGIRTIAEFVERPETVRKLEQLGVDYAQGYGIAKPAPLE